MRKILLLVLSLTFNGLTEECPLSASCPVKKFNEQGFGTFSGRIQSLSMFRDYDQTVAVNTGANTSLGFLLKYVSPELAGLDVGLAWNYTDELFKNNNTRLLLNDNINVLNEAWLRYRLNAVGLSNTTIKVGRQIIHGEVFRSDDFRHKARSVEAVQITTEDLPDTKLTIGHAIRMSNWILLDDRGDFNDFGVVPGFSASGDEDGITWGELLYTGFQGLEIAVFDALAHDIANLFGTRIKYNFSDDTAINGLFRYEKDVGAGTDQNAKAYGLSLQQKVGDFTLEPGWFGVRGDNLLFEETTTGINHPLGASMIIYAQQFEGGADTAYLKATTKVGQTSLYGLYNYTWHDTLPFDAQEFNVIIRQPICDQLSLAFRGGMARREYKDGSDDRMATDLRLTVTYSF